MDGTMFHSKTDVASISGTSDSRVAIAPLLNGYKSTQYSKGSMCLSRMQKTCRIKRPSTRLCMPKHPCSWAFSSKRRQTIFAEESRLYGTTVLEAQARSSAFSVQFLCLLRHWSWTTQQIKSSSNRLFLGCDRCPIVSSVFGTAAEYSSLLVHR